MAEDVATKIEDFFSNYRLRKYTKGQILIFNGDQPEYIYHLLKGQVKLYDVTYRGDEMVLNIFKPPAFFPMSLAINKGENKYIYEAETDVEIRQAPADDVIKMIKSNPDVMFDLLSRVYRGTDGLLGRMGHLMASSAKSRLMYELVIDALRFGKQSDDGSCVLMINERELGARAGLSRETVSREMSKLKKDDLIEIRNKDILIKNLQTLQDKLNREI